MDTFGILGFVLGSTGMTFGIISWSYVASLSKDFEELKKSLEDTGVLKERVDSGNK